MTLPHLNGKTGTAISVTSLLAALGVGGAVIKDRIDIAQRLATLEAESRERFDSNRGRINETDRRLAEIERRLIHLEQRNSP